MTDKRKNAGGNAHNRAVRGNKGKTSEKSLSGSVFSKITVHQKIKQFFWNSNLLWCGVGVLLGAIASVQTLKFMFFLSFLLVWISIFQPKLFEGHRWYFRFLGYTALTSLLMAFFLVVWIFTPKPKEQPTFDQQLETFSKKFPWILRKDEEEKWLEMYPWGYAIFELDSVTNAVQPINVQEGAQHFAFDFRNVSILKNKPDYISIRLPEVTKNGQAVLAGEIGGYRSAMQRYGAGVGAYDSVDKVGILGNAQVLEYGPNTIRWIFGIRPNKSIHS